MAYKAYLIRFNEEVAKLQQQLESRLAAARKLAVQAELTTLRRDKISHFDFLEDIVGYMVIKVGSCVQSHRHLSAYVCLPSNCRRTTTSLVLRLRSSYRLRNGGMRSRYTCGLARMGRSRLSLRKVKLVRAAAAPTAVTTMAAAAAAAARSACVRTSGTCCQAVT